MADTGSPDMGTAGARWALAGNVLTILLLLAYTPVGIVAIWTIAPWSRRAKVTITVIAVPVALFLLWSGFTRELLSR